MKPPIGIILGGGLGAFADELTEARATPYANIPHVRCSTAKTDVRMDFAHADIVGRRTVFNIYGNNYRLIARIFSPSFAERVA